MQRASAAARRVARGARRGLVTVLSGSDPPPRWPWRSPGQRWLAGTSCVVVTLVLSAASVAGQLGDQASQQTGYTGNGLPPGLGTGPGSANRLSHQTWRTAVGWTHLLGWVPGGVATILWVLAVLGAVVPVALAIRYPLLAWRIGWLALLLVPLPGLSWWGGLPWNLVQILVLLVVLCAASARHGRAVLCWLWALTLLPWWFWVLRAGSGVVTATLGTVAFAALGVAVDAAASRRRSQSALADQTEQTELERARRAVLEERSRIARELHDVVAHHMSLMAIRAESAPHRLGDLPDPEQVRAEFSALSGSARDALADMRRLLGVLRNDQPAARAPQPGLTDLPGLIETARQAGMAVELSPLCPKGALVSAARVPGSCLVESGSVSACRAQRGYGCICAGQAG
jgi:signal transduction histidine kinase